MKIAIMGAGGIGAYFGARLQADRHKVAFVARGAHLEAMRRDGLKVRSPVGDLDLARVAASDDPSAFGVVDIVLFCVKLWDVEAAAEAIRPMLAPETAVVPLQNGVSVCDTLEGVLGAQAVMGGVAKISATIEAPGMIRHNGQFARLIFGERDGRRSARAEALHAACRDAGIEAHVSDSIELEIWKKFVFLAPLAGAQCFYRAPMGAVMEDPEKRACLAALMAETAAVGRAKGIALRDDEAERTLAAAAALPAHTKPSMLVDLERGRRLELPWLNGEVVRLGEMLGVETPQNAAVTEALMPYAEGRAA